LNDLGKFGELKRVSNSNQIDVIADLFIQHPIPGMKPTGTLRESLTIEVKDHKNNMTSKELLDILERIPCNSLIHLVFVNGLQDEYFTNKKNAFNRAFGSNHPARNRKYYQLVQFQLYQCEFGNDVSYQGIVIFVVL
jgi:hypothetical protein